MKRREQEEGKERPTEGTKQRWQIGFDSTQSGVVLVALVVVVMVEVEVEVVVGVQEEEDG